MGGRETAGRFMMETYHSTDQDAGALWEPQEAGFSSVKFRVYMVRRIFSSKKH